MPLHRTVYDETVNEPLQQKTYPFQELKTAFHRCGFVSESTLGIGKRDIVRFHKGEIKLSLYVEYGQAYHLNVKDGVYVESYSGGAIETFLLVIENFKLKN